MSGAEPPVLRDVDLIKQMSNLNVHKFTQILHEMLLNFRHCRCLNTCTVRFSIKMLVSLKRSKRSAHRMKLHKGLASERLQEISHIPPSNRH
jgi:hypothetical protein